MSLDLDGRINQLRFILFIGLDVRDDLLGGHDAVRGGDLENRKVEIMTGSKNFGQSQIIFNDCSESMSSYPTGGIFDCFSMTVSHSSVS